MGRVSYVKSTLVLPNRNVNDEEAEINLVLSVLEYSLCCTRVLFYSLFHLDCIHLHPQKNNNLVYYICVKETREYFEILESLK